MGGGYLAGGLVVLEATGVKARVHKHSPGAPLGGGGSCGSLSGSQHEGGVVAFSGRHGLVYGLGDGYLAALYLYVSYLYAALVGEAVDAQRAHVLVGLG